MKTEQSETSAQPVPRGKGLAIVATVIGVSGLIMAAGSFFVDMPFLGIGWTMAILSLVLAIVAIVIASNQAKTTAIVALVVGLLSLGASAAAHLEA